MAKKIIQPYKNNWIARELIGLLFLAFGVFALVCLISYHPLDPSFGTFSQNRVIANWGGLLGSYVADSLVSLFGLSSFLIGPLFVLVALFQFTGTPVRERLKEAVVSLLTLFLSAILIQLFFGEILWRGGHLQAGGLFGLLLTRVGEQYIGRIGMYLIAGLGTLGAVSFTTGFSIQQIGRTLAFHGVPHLKTGGGFIWDTLTKIKTAFGLLVEHGFKKIDSSRLQFTSQNKTKSDVKISSLPKDLSTPQLSAVIPVPVKNAVQKSDESFSTKDSFKESAKDYVEPRILDRLDKKKTPKPVSSQLELERMSEGYQLPPVSLLDSETQADQQVDAESLKMQARMLEKKLLDFSVEGRVTEIHPGPVITMYEFEPAPGVKLSRIANLVDDLSLAMGGRPVRIVAPLPNKPAVGIEIPNNVRETVWLKDIIADEKFISNESRLIFALGKDIEGIPYVSDLAKMPHLLVAGATGAGKSVSINSMIISILYKATPAEVRLIMVDPKMLELSIYEGIPHLLLPVVTEPKKAALALRWAVREMERRYKLLSDINARNIINYNKKVEKKDFVSRQGEQIKAGLSIAEEDVLEHTEKLPYIVILIDELADLMMVSSREVEEAITRLAQMARAAGIHLILATQRPSVDVLTGVIKANFPARISFKVSSKHDSRTILDTVGSEHLLGNGDMLMIPPGASRMIRVHGAFVTESEIARVVEFLKKQAKPVYDESILKPVEVESEGGVGVDEEADELYDQAVSIVTETRQASISMVQRRLRIGYNRAARMIERMEAEGIVSSASGAGQRQVLAGAMSEILE